MQIVAFQFFSPGAPFIYYGDEVGMWGADDPDCRKPMIWPDINYENESATPFGPSRENVSEVKQNESLLNFYTQLCSIRKRSSALKRGDFKIMLADNNSRVIAFKRKYQKDTCIAIFNASNRPVPMPIIEKDFDLLFRSEHTSLKRLGDYGFALFIKKI